MTDKKLIYITLIIFIGIVLYGFYEKDRRAQLLTDFRNNQPLQCDDIIVRQSDGWKIGGNRVFTNGKIAKTIIFCKSIKK
ncbi:MAG: hypothetical protein K8R39_07865 [Arcobacteraceae bacterium]|nr:hypothetical protein [Arcobacteraceae bacterium]